MNNESPDASLNNLNSTDNTPENWPALNRVDRWIEQTGDLQHTGNELIEDLRTLEDQLKNSQTEIKDDYTNSQIIPGIEQLIYEIQETQNRLSTEQQGAGKFLAKHRS